MSLGRQKGAALSYKSNFSYLQKKREKTYQNLKEEEDK